MKKGRIMIKLDLKSKILLLFMLSVMFTNAQIKKLDVELHNNDGKIILRFKNNTNDTITFKSNFVLEQKKAKAHIISYKKNCTKDSVFYSRGAIWEYFNNELKSQIQLKENNSFTKIPPQTIQEYPFSYFNKGTYYIEIQTFFIYRKKYYFLNVITDEIDVE